MRKEKKGRGRDREQRVRQMKGERRERWMERGGDDQVLAGLQRDAHIWSGSSMIFTQPLPVIARGGGGDEEVWREDGVSLENKEGEVGGGGMGGAVIGGMEETEEWLCIPEVCSVTELE